MAIPRRNGVPAKLCFNQPSRVRNAWLEVTLGAFCVAPSIVSLLGHGPLKCRNYKKGPARPIRTNMKIPGHHCGVVHVACLGGMVAYSPGWWGRKALRHPAFQWPEVPLNLCEESGVIVFLVGRDSPRSSRAQFMVVSAKPATSVACQVLKRQRC